MPKIFIFDKGHNDYKAFKTFTENKTGFVTRIKDNAVYATVQTNAIEDHVYSGVLQVEIIEITVKDTSAQSVDASRKLKLRKVRFYDRVLKLEFEFLTKLFEMRTDLVADIYKLRW